MKKIILGLFGILILSLGIFLFAIQREQIQELSKPSDEKILIEKIKTTKDKIGIYNKVIIENTNSLNKTKLENTCYKAQLDRLIEGLEYNLDYCQGDNLQKFVGLTE